MVLLFGDLCYLLSDALFIYTSDVRNA